VHPQADGRVKLLTPRDARTGRDSRLFDPLDWVHAVTTQIPDPRRHMVRYYGAYANRARRMYRPSSEDGAEATQRARRTEASAAAPADEPWRQARRRSWARLLARIYEVDPFLCPRCGGEMQIVAAITDPAVVDAILAHRRRQGLLSPFESRAPPAV